MPDVLCPSCRIPANFWGSVPDINRQMTTEVFPWYRCGACRSMFIAPLPADLGRFYPNDYHPIPDDIATFRKGLPIQAFKVDILKRYVASGRLLEIGPSFCEALYLAKEAGFECTGLERSDRCCRFASEVLGLNEVLLEDHPVEAIRKLGTFNAIMLWQVLEHLPDPMALLAAAGAALAPGGVFITAQPNPLSLQLRIFGRRWAHLDAPRHVCLFSPQALDACAAEHGLQREAIIYNDAGGLGWNKFGWTFSLPSAGKRVKPAFGFRVLGKLMSLMATPFEGGHLGTSYTAVYRKVAS